MSRVGTPFAGLFMTNNSRHSRSRERIFAREILIIRDMNVSEIFIKRPVMTSLVMAAFLFAGLFGYFSLPVNELPNVDFPTIVVSASLPGADAETMASTVATPLETQFSLIAGLDTMSSTNVLGATQITLQFRLDRNIDAAAQDVQSAMAAAARQLPLNLPAPPTMRKVN